MKIFTTLLFTLFSFHSLHAQKIATDLSESWENGNWAIKTKGTYSYDGNCYLTNSLYQNWDVSSTSWINSSQSNYTNSTTGLQLETLSQQWVAGSWVDDQHETRTYNSAGQMTSYLWEILENGIMAPAALSTLTYQPNGDRDNVTTQSWDASSNSWINSSRSVFSYENGNNTLVTTQYWDDNLADWVSYQTETMVFNTEHRMIEQTIVSMWTGTGAWVNYSHDTYIIGSNGYAATLTSQMWDTASGSWKNRFFADYSERNADGKLTQYIFKNWDNATNAWVNSSRHTLTYTCFPAPPPPSVVPDPSTTSILIYPNPTTDKLNIVLVDNGKAQYSIVDFQGKIISTGAFDGNKATIDINNLPANIYFINVVQGNKTIGKKFIKN